MRIPVLMIALAVAAGCNGSASNKPGAAPSNGATKTARASVPVAGYEIVNVYPHDKSAFTQGLIFHGGVFYESTGQYGESTLRKVDVTTGKVLKKHELAEDYFAEGMTIIGQNIYQITWREQTAFVYDLDFKLIREKRYTGEGWGLTNDGTNLVMSDGTHVLRFVNPESFETVKTLTVKDENGRPIYKLNELEWVKGEIWANIWHSDQIGKPNHIARIDPNSGNLLGWIDLKNISPDDTERDSENVLNGIAYDSATDRIFVTGKNWKKLFEIKLKN